ncbi:hypothetical protein [Shewanella sp.]|uniref:hypothetical protein n=1 Tax=Shewanella sp. TaxID=50422 RepID=UPI003A971616
MGLLLNIQEKLPLQLQGCCKLSGVSAAEKRRKLVREQHQHGELVGSWRDQRPNLDDEILLYREADKWIMETWFNDGSHSCDEMTAQETEVGVRLEEKGGNFFGEFFVLKANGALVFCRDDGCFYTASQVNAA